jgi:hypothetical protein
LLLRNAPSWKSAIRYLYLIILIDHEGVTNHLNGLVVGDEPIIDDAWGAIQYKGKGVLQPVGLWDFIYCYSKGPKGER